MQDCFILFYSVVFRAGFRVSVKLCDHFQVSHQSGVVFDERKTPGPGKPGRGAAIHVSMISELFTVCLTNSILDYYSTGKWLGQATSHAYTCTQVCRVVSW